MNTTVRTRRSGSGPAAAGRPSRPPEPMAADTTTLPRKPVRPDPQAPSRGAPSPSAAPRDAAPRDAASRPTGSRTTGSRTAGSRSTGSSTTGSSTTGSRITVRTGAGGQVAGRSPRPAATAAPQAPAAARQYSARTPFILLVIGLLSGGLVCLLLINTTLATGSYEIGKLQQDNTATSQRLQELQQQVSSEESPASVQQRALRLGLRQQQVLNFVDLRTGLTYSTAANLPPMYDVPGYTP